MVKPNVEFSEKERYFIDNVLGIDEWPFNPDCDDDEFSVAAINEILVEIGNAVKDYDGVVESIITKTEPYLPKPNFEIVNALQKVMSKHQVQPPVGALEDLSIEIAKRIDAWKL